MQRYCKKSHRSQLAAGDLLLLFVSLSFAVTEDQLLSDALPEKRPLTAEVTTNRRTRTYAGVARICDVIRRPPEVDVIGESGSIRITAREVEISFSTNACHANHCIVLIFIS